MQHRIKDPRVPCHFDSLSMQQQQDIEERAIHTNNNYVRFLQLKAAKGSNAAQSEFMTFLQQHPDWLAK